MSAEGLYFYAVSRGLPITPDVVGDRGAHMALQVGVVWRPATRARVQVQDLALLAAAGPALPGVHRAAVAGLVREPSCGREASEAVEQESPGDLGEVEVQERQDEQLVPEDVTAIGFAMKPARRDADVEVARVRRDRLQQVEDVEPENHLRVRLAIEPDVAAIPHGAPRLHV